MNANPAAPTPTEGSAAVRLGTALQYAQEKTGYSLADILDEATSVFFSNVDHGSLPDDEADSALIALVYEHF